MLKDFYQTNKRRIILFILMLLIGSTSFGLGYLLAKDYNRTPIVIENR